MPALTLPNPSKIKATSFRLQRLQAFNPLRGGHHQTVDMGEPIWMCELSTTPLGNGQAGNWKALFARLRGMARTLLLWDADRPRPLAYASTASDAYIRIGRGGGVRIGESRRIGCPTRPWGNPFVIETNRTDSMIKVAGAVAGAEFTEGDYVAFTDGPARRLFLVVEDAVLDAGGGGWLLVEPAPPASASVPAALELHCPMGEFVVREGRVGLSGPGMRDASLQAVQIIQRS